MGDFTGFTFGGYHSFDDLGVIRVSGGDRYEEELQSEIKDRTAEVPGLNGEYYFGSDYAPKKFNIEIAFDSLTEEQFRKLRRVFGTKRVQELIFDERPYKKYMAKIESPVELSYVCFDEPKRHQSSTTSNGIRRDRENDQEYVPGGEITDSITVLAGETTSFTLTHIPNGEVVIEPIVEYVHEEGTYIYSFSNEGEEPITITLTYTYDATPFEAAWEQIIPWVYDEGTQRIYKGEGKISFVCYFPFAKSVYKELPEGSEEWASSSGLLTAAQRSEIDIYSNSGIKTYNPGDLSVGFRLYIPGSNGTIGATTISYKNSPELTNVLASLVLDEITLKTGDIGILIDTNNQIVVGVSEIDTYFDRNNTVTTTGNLYNEYINAGYFFHLEPNLGPGDYSYIDITNGISGIKIFYDYLYF